MRSVQERTVPDPMGLARNAPELILENERVRVIRSSIKAGDTVAMHAHPDHIMYVEKGGRVQLTYPSGEIETMELETGKAIYMNAQSHEAKNVGDTVLELVVIELR